MAFMSQENKKELAPAIKAVLKKYNTKASISVRHHSTLMVNIKQSAIPFDLDGRTYKTINSVYDLTGTEKDFITELFAAMDGLGDLKNFDRSDVMTDYFNVGWYTQINVGTFSKPYISA